MPQIEHAKPVLAHAQCDVLVIGLGPAGGAAAAAAAQCGLSVIAVEKKAAIGVPVQCAEFIPLPLARYAQSRGVPQQKITGMNSVLPSGAAVATPFSGLMIDRAAFDQALAAAAAAAGAALHAGARLVALDAERARAVIARPDGELEIRFEVLIAADGPHSVVAGELGLPALRTVNTRQYSVPLLQPFADTDIWLSQDYPGGYAWLFPKASHANLGLGLDPRYAADMKSPLDALHCRLAEQGRVGREVLSRTGGAIPVGGLRERLSAGRVMFAGDAAGLTHPITGAGIGAAVMSGERAAEAAHALLAKNDANALVEYEEDMREQFGESLARGVARRRELENIWNTPFAANDAAHQRGWIAFDDYYRNAAA
ncbi:MAG: NAD(P)/FAD-dependent oxidoreductase [Pseudomonadota bacterium]